LATPANNRDRAFFGDYEFDFRSGQLRRNGTVLKLQPQPARILAILIDNAGEMVSREELAKQVWGSETYGDFEGGLNFAVRQIRSVLEDSVERPRFLETVPKRGYRFIAQVNDASPIQIQTPERPDTRSSLISNVAWRYAVVFLVSAAAVIVVVASGWQFLRTRSSGQESLQHIEALAVLPLQNLSGDPSQDYFADGMTDELTTRLAKIKSIRVISRTSAMRYKNVRKPLPEIARELKVDAVVEGSVTRSGSRVRIDAQLVEANSDHHLWADSYERDFRDVLSLQADIAQGIVNEVRIQVTPQQKQDLHASLPVEPQAYEAFLRGRYSWNKRSAEGVRAATAYFSDAIARDPGFARAYAGMAECYAVYSFYNPRVPPRESYQKTRAAAEKALELDDRLAEAHTALAIVKFLNDGDWEGSQQEFQRAIDRNPNYAPAHQWYAEWLYDQARFPEAETEMRKAYQLDPLSLVIGTALGDVFYYSRQFQRAVDLERQVLSLEPNFGLAHESLAFDYIQQSKFPEAVAEMQSARRHMGEDPAEYARLGYAYAMAGQRRQAETILRNLIAQSSAGHPQSFEIALIYVGLQQKDRALTWLVRAVEERGELISALGVDPIWDSLRADPRFIVLLSRLGLSGWTADQPFAVTATRSKHHFVPLGVKTKPQGRPNQPSLSH
jgi:TolB-like protein/DNA-binding winged helix-turn-helix (wHTH) protein/Flp pilus assembly protein TadD